MSKVCRSCGATFDSSFCPYCGAPAEQSSQQTPPNQSYYNPYAQNQYEANSNRQQPYKNKPGCLLWAVIIFSVIIFLIIFSIIVSGSLFSFKKGYKESVESTVSSDIKVEEATGELSEVVITPTATPEIASETTPTATPTIAPVIEEYLTKEEIQDLYSDPNTYKGRNVKISGMILNVLQTEEGGFYIYMYQDAVNYGNITLVEYNGMLKATVGDYIIIDGIVDGKYDGFNFTGSTIVPDIVADTAEIGTYQEAISPAEKVVDVNEIQEQSGYEVVVEKVEFSPIETRVYITVNNNGDSNLMVYSSLSKLLQGKSQYDQQSNFIAEYPELQMELLPGASTSGVMCFPVISQTKDFKLYLKCNSYNFKENLEDYIFTIKVK